MHHLKNLWEYNRFFLTALGFAVVFAAIGRISWGLQSYGIWLSVVMPALCVYGAINSMMAGRIPDSGVSGYIFIFCIHAFLYLIYHALHEAGAPKVVIQWLPVVSALTSISMCYATFRTPR